jgi:5'-nucleotidase/UDP-sugar diphosphatase
MPTLLGRSKWVTPRSSRSCTATICTVTSLPRNAVNWATSSESCRSCRGISTRFAGKRKTSCTAPRTIWISCSSHTILEQPAFINNILIAQAGTGTDQIGRFDITVDDDTNSIVDWKWSLVPIDNAHCTPDADLERFIDGFRHIVDMKYGSIISKFTRTLTHPERTRETELGPAVTLGDYLALFPYDDSVTRFTVTGAQLKHAFSGFMRPENCNGEGEYYQVNRGVCAVYDRSKHDLVSLTLAGTPVDNARNYFICLQGYHYKNAEVGLQWTAEELEQIEKPRLLATSCRDIVEEYLHNHQNVNAEIEGRLQYV